MLTREECTKSLNQFIEDTDYCIGDVTENNHEDEIDILRDLIKEHFDNPPLKKIMTAQEMFEDLGYKKTENDNHAYIIIWEDASDSKKTIGFMDTKDIRHEFKGCNISSVYAGFFISNKLMKAINQQLKELEWLDD